jgi:hypothetical protein
VEQQTDRSPGCLIGQVYRWHKLDTHPRLDFIDLVISPSQRPTHDTQQTQETNMKKKKKKKKKKKEKEKEDGNKWINSGYVF